MPQDPHPQQKALFCQQVVANEVVCSIERFDLLAVTTSLKESTKGNIINQKKDLFANLFMIKDKI